GGGGERGLVRGQGPVRSSLCARSPARARRNLLPRGQGEVLDGRWICRRRLLGRRLLGGTPHQHDQAQQEQRASARHDTLPANESPSRLLAGHRPRQRLRASTPTTPSNAFQNAQPSPPTTACSPRKPTSTNAS